MATLGGGKICLTKSETRSKISKGGKTKMKKCPKCKEVAVKGYKRANWPFGRNSKPRRTNGVKCSSCGYKTTEFATKSQSSKQRRRK